MATAVRSSDPLPFEPRPALSPEQLAAGGIPDVRWWTHDELRASSALYAPRTLPDLVHRLRVEGIPSEPIDVGV
jgi:hypothetical protein